MAAATLDDADAKLFTMLSDASRFFVNGITRQHKLKDVGDASRLRRASPEATAELTRKLYPRLPRLLRGYGGGREQAEQGIAKCGRGIDIQFGCKGTAAQRMENF